MLSSCSSLPLCYFLTFVRSLSCSSVNNHHRGLSFLLQGPVPHSHLLQIHGQVITTGVHQDNLIATRLIGHYSPHLSLRVFYNLCNPNIFPFNAIIRVLSLTDGFFAESFSIFKTLGKRSILPNEFTFSFTLKACFRVSDGLYVSQMHTQIVKLGFDLNVAVCNGLLSVYAKGVRDLDSARKVFVEMPDKPLTWSWTSLIEGYAKFGLPEEALLLFKQMLEKNLSPVNDTMVSVLSVCSMLEITEIEKWTKIFIDFHDCMDHNNTCRQSLGIVLIYLYNRMGIIERCRDIFDKMTDRGKNKSLLAWNVILNSYVQNGQPLEALKLFKLMFENHSLTPNHVTMVSALSACSDVGDLNLGRWIHEYLKTNSHKDIIQSNPFLATALIDMYSKCGNLEEAKNIFEKLVKKDVVSFNALIFGLAINGEGSEAIKLFEQMELTGICPNSSTILGVLCACTHSGLVDVGRSIFIRMKTRYSVAPKLEHYACYVDLLSRAGYMEEAIDIVRTMPIEPNHLVWGSLLGASLVHNRRALAFDIANKLVSLDPENSGGYVMLSNAYAADCRWDDIKELRQVMRDRQVKKQPGCSWISVNGIVHEFHVGSREHTDFHEMCHVLNGLSEEIRLAG